MANPGSSSPGKGRKSERDNTSATGADNEPQYTQRTGSEVTRQSSAEPSWRSGGAAASPSQGQSTQRGQSTQSNGGNGIAQKLRDQANARLSSQKDRALDGVGGVTQAIRQTTQTLRDQQHDVVARYVEQVAGQVDRMAQSLRQKDIGELLDDAQRLARRQPALFVGSAFALGLLGARFLKSSPPDHVYSRGSSQGRSETRTGWHGDESARAGAFGESSISARE
jgi:hypothetical protein